MAGKFVFLHPRWQLGGVERTNLQWSKILQAKGIDCRYITICERGNDVKLKDIKGWAAHSWIGVVRLAIRELKSGDVLAVCQSYMVPYLIPLLFALRLRGVILWLAERNSFKQYDEYPVKKWIYKIIFPIVLPRLFNKIVVNSRELRESFPYEKFRNVYVVVNPRFDGDELNKCETLRKYKPREIVVFARWSSQKDPQFMIDASSIIRDFGYDYKVFCGRSDYDFQKPFVEDALEYLCTSRSAVLFCSKFEGYPNVLIEARAAGAPILYAPCPTGVTEILSDYENAIPYKKHCMKSFRSALASLRAEFIVRPDYKFFAEHRVDRSCLMTVYES